MVCTAWFPMTEYWYHVFWREQLCPKRQEEALSSMKVATDRWLHWISVPNQSALCALLWLPATRDQDGRDLCPHQPV